MLIHSSKYKRKCLPSFLDWTLSFSRKLDMRTTQWFLNSLNQSLPAAKKVALCTLGFSLKPFTECSGCSYQRGSYCEKACPRLFQSISMLGGKLHRNQLDYSGLSVSLLPMAGRPFILKKTCCSKIVCIEHLLPASSCVRT